MKFDQIDGLPDDRTGWGSDVAAAMLRRLGLRYISLNPGASYRGLHDSLVNHNGNTAPSILLCLHEDHAVAVAHGYAKVTGRAMGCALHSNVGLMHGSTALFNAWCDRVPMVVVGATGPVDAAKRRPWIDWIHTSKDQGAIVRSYVKWDDQPSSVAAMTEAFARAFQITETSPKAPVYICLDAGLQEAPLAEPPAWPNMAQFAPPSPPDVGTETLTQVSEILTNARRPLILCGRGARSEEAFAARVRLAESLGAVVFTDYKTGAQFPTDHPAHPVESFNKIGPDVAEVLAQADTILALDWVDLGGLLAAGQKAGLKPDVPVISATQDMQLHNGAQMDHQMLAPVDVLLPVDPDTLVKRLNENLAPQAKTPWRVRSNQPLPPPAGEKISLDHVAHLLRQAVDDPDEISLAALCRGWPLARWPLTHPLSYLGKDGGAGIGSGPGLAVGVALAVADMGRKAVAVLGDGDCVMGITAIWTAVRHRIPLLILLNNNRSYFNDELHQENVAIERGRNVNNRWIGQQLADPDIDFAKMAEGQGAVGIGPVTELADLEAAIAQGVSVLNDGGVAVIDIYVTPGQDRKAATKVQTRG